MRNLFSVYRIVTRKCIFNHYYFRAENYIYIIPANTARLLWLCVGNKNT